MLIGFTPIEMKDRQCRAGGLAPAGILRRRRKIPLPSGKNHGIDRPSDDVNSALGDIHGGSKPPALLYCVWAISIFVNKSALPPVRVFSN